MKELEVLGSDVGIGYYTLTLHAWPFYFGEIFGVLLVQ